MSFSEVNLESIRTEGYYLYKYLEKDNDFAKWKNNETVFVNSMIYSERSKDQHLITYIKKEDNIVRLNSKYYPTREASTWADQFSAKVAGRAHRLIYLFGLSNGYFVKELLKKIEENETVIIYEPMKEMLFYAMDNFDLVDIITNPKVFIFVEGINSISLKDFFIQSEVGMMYGDGVLINLPYYDEIYRDKYEWYKDLYTQSWVGAMINRNTAVHFGKDWAKAIINNLIEALRSNTIENYKGIIPEDIPVIVVAAGPSLEINVDTLKKAKGKAVILAVDTSLGCLYEHGIEPDFAVTLDVHKPMFLFENPLGKKVPMMISLSGNPSVVEYGEGKKVFFDFSNFLAKVKCGTDVFDGINSSGSVATATFDIARYMGAKTIILIGQDLAYRGEETHAMGLDLDVGHVKFASVEGNYGDQLWTRHDWYTFLLWYEKEIPHYDGIVVNATEGGAKIKGTEIMPLEDAIDKYCHGNIDTNKMLDSVTSLNINMQEVDDVFESLLVEFNEIIIISEEAIELCNYLIDENEKACEESYVAKSKVKRLAQINAQIKSYNINEVITQFIYEVYIDEYQTIFSRFDEERKNRLNVYRKAKKVYEAVNNAAKELRIGIEEQKEKHARKELPQC